MIGSIRFPSVGLGWAVCVCVYIFISQVIPGSKTIGREVNKKELKEV